MSDFDHELTDRENEIFESMLTAAPTVFRRRLVRDGVPRSDIYLAQAVRVVFVFREPNMDGKPYELDQRAQLRHPEQWQLRGTVWREHAHPLKGWWNLKVGSFCHAVLSALRGTPVDNAYAEFRAHIDARHRSHDFLFPFAFVQLKKVGGGAVANTDQVISHVVRFAASLRAQLALYEPDLVIGCGLGASSPARLLREHVLIGDARQRSVGGGHRWWQFDAGVKPVALLEFHHPSSRGRRDVLYYALHSGVRNIIREMKLKPSE